MPIIDVNSLQLLKKNRALALLEQIISKIRKPLDLQASGKAKYGLKKADLSHGNTY